MALTGLYIDEKYCKHEPPTAEQGNQDKTRVIKLLLKILHLQALTLTNLHCLRNNQKWAYNLRRIFISH